MSDGFSPARRLPRDAQPFRDEASELLASLQSKLGALEDAPEDTQKLAQELRAMIEEIRQALEN